MLRRAIPALSAVVVLAGAGSAVAITQQSAGGSTNSSAGQLDKNGKHCGDKNHIGLREDECKGGAPKR